MNILVTGTTGYLGSRITRYFSKHGHYLVGLKRRTSEIWRLKDIENDVELYDVENTDLKELMQSPVPIDVIVHTATNYGRSGESLSSMISANYILPMKLLEAGEACGVKFFINTDTSLGKYTSDYSLTKKQFLEAAKCFSKRSSISIMNIMLEHFYGPGDRSNKFVTKVIKDCLADCPGLALTQGDQKRDFVYIDDVLNAFEVIIDRLRKNKNCHDYIEYQVGSGTAVAIKDVVLKIHDICSSKTVLQFGKIAYRKNEVFHSQADLAKMKSLGWVPQYSLDEGLRLTVQYEKNKLNKA